MSTVNIGAALPTGSNVIGQVKLVDTGGTNQAAIDANNNLHVALYNAANSMGIDSSNNAHVGVWNGTNQMGVDGSGNIGVNVIGALPAGAALIGKVNIQAGGNSLATDNTNVLRVSTYVKKTAAGDTALSLGQATMANSLPVALATNQFQPSFVQKVASKSSGSVASLALAFGSNNTQDNSIVVVCGVGNGTAPTISDTNSNTYTQIAQIANGTAFNVAIFLGLGSTAGAGIASGANTVTVNNGGTTASIAMEIYEVQGLLAQVTAQPDQAPTNTGTSGTASTSTISPFSPNAYAFAGIGVGTAAQTITVGTGWTNDSAQQNPTTPAGLFSFISMSQFLGSLKAVTPQATFTSEPWAIAVATFRPVLLGVEGTVKLTDGTVTMAFGQNTMANSIPVAIASNQSNVPTNTVQVGGTAIDTNSGNKSAGTQRVVLATDQPSLTNALPVSQNGTWTIQPGNTANTTAWLVTPQATTAGGSTASHTISAASTNATSLKASAGLLYGFSISNSNASARFFKLYNKASAPTVGTDTPVMTVQVPGSGTVIRAFPVGLVFGTGIAWALTTGIADSDTGAVGTDISVDLDYK